MGHSIKTSLVIGIFSSLAAGAAFAQYPGKPACEKLKSPTERLMCMDEYADCTTPDWLSGVDRAACDAEERAKQKGLQELRRSRLARELSQSQRAKLKVADAAYEKFIQAQCALEASPVEGGSQYASDYTACAYHLKEVRLNDYVRVLKNFAELNNR